MKTRDLKLKALSILLVIVMLLGMLPSTALAAEDTTPAAITGMSITIDGVEYTNHNTSETNPAIITPNSTVQVKVYGTNLNNVTSDNYARYCPSGGRALTEGGWTIASDGTSATLSTTYTAPSNYESATEAYELLYGNSGSDATTFVGSGVYVIYNDGTGGEEDTTPAVITGVSIMVGGTTYTEGTVTLTPDSGDVTIIVSGTNLQNRTNNNKVKHNSVTYLPMGRGYAWSVNDTGTEARRTVAITNFESETTAHEIGYCNDGSTNYIGSGIYLTYDAGISEEDKAVITGVSITVDGKTYTEGNVTITPTSTVIITVTGTNFANVSDDNVLMYAPAYGNLLNSGWIITDDEANTATKDFSKWIREFESCNNFEVLYSNDGNVYDAYVGTGIYLTYNDGTGESELMSVNITWSEMSFTYTDGEWNPETHTYAVGEWTPDDENGNVITVTNNGNVDVNVTFTYDETVAEVEGSFTDESGSAIPSPFTLATGEEKKIKLILNGKPSSTFEDTKLGTVTVAITLPEG